MAIAGARGGGGGLLKGRSRVVNCVVNVWPDPREYLLSLKKWKTKLSHNGETCNMCPKGQSQYERSSTNEELCCKTVNACAQDGKCVPFVT